MDNPHLHGFFLSLANPEPSPPSISGGVDRLPDGNAGSSTQPQRGRKKGSKDAPIRLHSAHLVDHAGIPKPKFKRKPPDPSSSAAHATAPCSECGKRFWSQKALFGHMRCHPEREWRGINPPLHLRRPLLQGSSSYSGTPQRSTPLHRPRLTFGAQEIFHDAELEAAACLLMLANGPTPAGALGAPPMPGMDGFGCRSGCSTLYGSQQARGGQLAARENMTASTFAGVIRTNKAEDESLSGINCSSSAASGDSNSGRGAAEGMVMMVSGDGRRRHGASSSNGQALEERMRRHSWDGEERVTSCPSGGGGYVPDLNLPPPVDSFDSSA